MAERDDDYAGEDDDDDVDIRTFDQLKDIIEERHNLKLGKRTPQGVFCTLQGILIEDLQALLRGHRRKLDEILEETGRLTAHQVKECLQVLKDETLDSSLRQTLARVSEEAERASTVRTALTRLRNTTFIMVALSWVALFLNLIVLIRS